MYYTLSKAEYWRYYYLILYYRFAELPLVVKVCMIFTTLCLLGVVILILGNFFKAFNAAWRERKVNAFRKEWRDPILSIALDPRPIQTDEILERLAIPKGYRMRERVIDHQVPVLLEIFQEHRDRINRENWRLMLRAMRVPAYFERQVRSGQMRRRIAGLKNIADMDADLKEAVASRYLFSRNRKLQNNARLHAARFGTSYPFRVLEEDPNMVFTEELAVKYHDVLAYRQANGLSMPNFIHWCRRIPVNEEFRIFAVNEIRLLGYRDACPQLREMLEESRDERFSCALIRTLGEMKYIPAEAVFRRRYPSASFEERQTLAEALGMINSGSADVVRFLEYDYAHATDAVSRMKLLRVLYDYGDKGRAAYERLKREAAPDKAVFFEHIECNLIDSRKYA